MVDLKSQNENNRCFFKNYTFKSDHEKEMREKSTKDHYPSQDTGLWNKTYGLMALD